LISVDEPCLKQSDPATVQQLIKATIVIDPSKKLSMEVHSIEDAYKKFE